LWEKGEKCGDQKQKIFNRNKERVNPLGCVGGAVRTLKKGSAPPNAAGKKKIIEERGGQRCRRRQRHFAYGQKKPLQTGY